MKDIYRKDIYIKRYIYKIVTHIEYTERLTCGGDIYMKRTYI